MNADLNTAAFEGGHPIRVALVEDDVHFQNTLAAAIDDAPDITLLSVAGTRARGLKVINQLEVDVLLVDLGLPDGSGIDVIRAAHAKWPDCSIMVNTTFADEAHVIESLEAGASGYLLKDAEPKDMLDEIRSLHGGGSPISPLIARQILLRFRTQRPTPAPTDAPPAQAQADAKPRATLTAREHEVLQHITRGLTADEIARRLSMSRHTVLTHVRHIYSKLEVNSKAKAIYEARSQGLV